MKKPLIASGRPTRKTPRKPARRRKAQPRRSTTRPSTRAPVQPAATACPPEVLDKVVLLLTRGMPQATVEATCTRPVHPGMPGQPRGLGIAPALLAAVLAEAKLRILGAARWDRTEQAGMSITRLNDLYSRCLVEADTATALATQREINKLLGLYNADPADGPDGARDADALREQVAAATAYLQPLGLGHEDTPLSELARLAVVRIVELEARNATLPPEASGAP